MMGMMEGVVILMIMTLVVVMIVKNNRIFEVMILWI